MFHVFLFHFTLNEIMYTNTLHKFHSVTICIAKVFLFKFHYFILSKGHFQLPKENPIMQCCNNTVCELFFWWKQCMYYSTRWECNDIKESYPENP